MADSWLYPTLEPHCSYAAPARSRRCARSPWKWPVPCSHRWHWSWTTSHSSATSFVVSSRAPVSSRFPKKMPGPSWSVAGGTLERPSLVITDINMPRLDGIEMVRGLRERWPALPVVFVTGNPFWAPRATPLGEVVLKPFDAETLLAAARRAVLSSALDVAFSRTGSNARAGSLLHLDEEAPARLT